MTGFDREKARAALAALPLSEISRRFADTWLSVMSDEGRLDLAQFDTSLGQEILSRTVSFEITPSAILIRSAGHHIVEAVGMPLVGQDYLQMAPPAQRPIRLARMCSIVEGHISTHQRWVVNTTGKLHVLNELAVPCGLSENGLPVITTYVDVDSQSSVGHIEPKKGAMNIAPVFETYPIHSAA
jgi:hypothetical protein